MLPERVDSKAILLPSGENCGLKSTRVEEMKGWGGLKRPVTRFDSMRQMLWSFIARVYARRPGWGMNGAPAPEGWRSERSAAPSPREGITLGFPGPEIDILYSLA